MHFLKIITILILTIFSTGCFLLPKEEESLAPPLMNSTAISYEVIKVKRGDIENRLIVEGKFISRNRSSLSFNPYGGILKSMRARVGSIVRKGEILAELDKERLFEDLQLQKMALETAELNLQRVKYEKNVDKKLAEVALKKQRFLTQQAEKRYNNSNLYAPFDGVIVYKDKKFLIGEPIPAYHILYSIANPYDLEIEYRGSHENEFFYGMDVEIEPKNPPGGESAAEGKIYRAFVSQTPRETPEEEDPNDRNSVFFQMADGPVPGLKMGMECYISVTLERAENVLIIPRNLIQTDSVTATVFVLEDGVPKERVVETGILTAREVQIISGLEEGEEVVKR